MFKLKKIGVMSFAKLYGGLSGLMGLIVGVLFFLISLVGVALGTGIGGLVVGIGILIFLPIIYGIAGFVMGAISAFLYNIVASKVGGIELELEE